MIDIDGSWRLDLTCSVASGNLTPVMRASLDLTANIIQQAARDIRSGKLSTAESARRVLTHSVPTRRVTF
jgi:hypothetical protein